MIRRTRSRRTPPGPRAVVALAAFGAAAAAGALALLKQTRGRRWSERARERLRPVMPRVGRGGRAPDDAALRERVEESVFRDEHRRGRIDVKVESGAVVLHGELDSPAQITAAEKAARKVRGVRTVTALISLPETQRYRHVP
jgi:osmotically-inducible protein OsmY